MKVYPSPQGDIHLGNIEGGLEKVIHNLDPTNVFLIADENTKRDCAPAIQSITSINATIVIPPGEINKNLDNCRYIWSQLIKHNADRDSLILNVGGGMICDLGGFAASCYQRGIRFAHIPTSVMAMADAAIGGKTGIDYEGFKNYIGHFDLPVFIWIDPAFIGTLPFKEIKSGFAEIIKHAIIYSRTLWDIVSALPSLESIDWEKIFQVNVPIKQRIIETDLKEKGLRKILNFGHTLGHALESHFMHSTQPLSHGEAVTLGMMGESRIALDMGLLDPEDFRSINDLIHRLLQPAEVTLPSAEELMPWIMGDKKKKRDSVGFSLPDRIGSCGWDIGVENQLIVSSLDWLSTQVQVPG